MILSRISKQVLHSIPVLSIFVLLGIIGYATISIGFREVDGEVYAAETVSNNTSLIIDNGTATDSTATVRNGVAYSSHTVQVKADNITGYSLTITGPTSLSNGGTTISGAGGKTGSTMNDNTWGYGWNTTSTADANMIYNSFPTTNNGTVTLESSNSVSSIDFTKKLVFAAKFNQNAAEGHYRANVKLNLTVTPKTVTTYNYSVTYYGNNNTSGSAPVTQTATSSNTPYALYAANQGTLVRTGYDFLGWSESSNATSATYTAGSAISLSSSNSTKSLYAVWERLMFNGITIMQEMTPAICANAVIGDSKTLQDSRGNIPYTTYTIRKLSDGNCWMVDNLKLDLSSVTLTPSNSNVASNYTVSTDSNVTSASKWSTTSSDNKAQFNMNGFGNTRYKSDYGYYYNWYVATAGSGTYSMSSGDASGSICPAGWKLPRSSNFQTLYNKFTTATWATINSISGRWLGAVSASAGGAFFLAAGRIVTSSGLDYIGSIGSYWSRTASNNGHADALDLYSSTISPAGELYKYSGLPVRCVAYSS